MEQQKQHKIRLSSFSVILIMVVLMVIGAAMIPLLNVQLYPSSKHQQISISFSWPGASARVVEAEVTSKLEGVLGTIRGIQNMESESYRDRGVIILDFKKNENIEAIRFEISTLIKYIYPKLPEGVGYPYLSGGVSHSESSGAKMLLTYTINSSLPSSQIKKFMDEYVVDELIKIEGVNDVIVSGEQPYQWIIEFNAAQCRALNISPRDISDALSARYKNTPLGISREFVNGDTLQIAVHLQSGNKDEILGYGGIEALPVKKVNDRIIYLGDIADVTYKEKDPVYYYRINGRNNLTMTVFSEEDVNEIDVAKRVRAKMDELEQRVPPEYAFILTSDNSEYLQQDLRKIYRRTFMSVAILLAFVYLVSRKMRYLALIVITMAANILLAFIFYRLFNLDLHLYSLAGFTVSLGLIIDTTIIMIDHYSYYHNRKAFLAILAALLTTIGSLCIVFFLPESQQKNLVEFSAVIIINLSVSLCVALFFVPALLDKLPLNPVKSVRQISRRRRLVRMTRLYERHILFSKRHKWLYIVLFLLIFGLPIHLLPPKITEPGENYYARDEKKGFFPELYNKTIGSAFYQEKLKKYVEYALGGAFRLFNEHNATRFRVSNDVGRPTINISVAMPEGCTVHQLNDLVKIMENYLSGFDEIDIYQTSVTNYNRGQITVYFKKDFEYGVLPLLVKEQIIAKAINIGGADWNISGIDMNTFNNSVGSGGYISSGIVMKGYSYEQLYRYAQQLADSLSKNRRVNSPMITGGTGVWQRNKTEFFLDFDFESFAYHDLSPYEYYSFLQTKLYQKDGTPIITREGNKEEVFIISDESRSFDVWHLENDMVNIRDSQVVKLADLGKIQKRRTGNDIYKTNQEFILMVGFNFLGGSDLQSRLIKRNVEMMNGIMPLGYKAENRWSQGGWYEQSKGYFGLLLLIAVIIYFICAILFESLIQPFAIIMMIPVSFIGLFLVFPVLNLPLDDGVFAAMVLLSGIVVNAGIYIVNEYNILQKKNHSNRLKNYLRAYNHKIIPILLTVLSTVLGLIPFLWDGINERFWFSFAAGAMGGMLFSLIALLLCLPLIMPVGKNEKIRNMHNV